MEQGIVRRDCACKYKSLVKQLSSLGSVEEGSRKREGVGTLQLVRERPDWRWGFVRHTWNSKPTHCLRQTGHVSCTLARVETGDFHIL